MTKERLKQVLHYEPFFTFWVTSSAVSNEFLCIFSSGVGSVTSIHLLKAISKRERFSKELFWNCAWQRIKVLNSPSSLKELHPDETYFKHLGHGGIVKQSQNQSASIHFFVTPTMLQCGKGTKNPFFCLSTWKWLLACPWSNEYEFLSI